MENFSEVQFRVLPNPLGPPVPEMALVPGQASPPVKNSCGFLMNLDVQMSHPGTSLSLSLSLSLHSC